MAKITTRGICEFCGGGFSKSAIARHLKSCSPKVEKSRQDAESKAYHLIVEGAFLPHYWMHLAINPSSPLEALDFYLRAAWLECCGHLSAFRFGGVTYSQPDPYEEAGNSAPLSAEIGRVVKAGDRFSYEYDYGSTTELTLEVLGSWEGSVARGAVMLLARNEAPATVCEDCKRPGHIATQICTDCIWDDVGWLCNECFKDHGCDRALALPAVNSPRAGVCGYTGED